jgi:hypothetical protein
VKGATLRKPAADDAAWASAAIKGWSDRSPWRMAQ